MKITAKIFLSSFSILVLLVIVAVVGIDTVNSLGKDISRYHQLASQTNASGRIQANMLSAHLFAKNYIINASDNNIKGVDEKISATLKHINNLKNIVTSERKLASVERLQSDLETYRRAFIEVTNLQEQIAALIEEGLDTLGPNIEVELTNINESIGKTELSSSTLISTKALRAFLLARLYIHKFLVTQNTTLNQRVQFELTDLSKQQQNLIDTLKTDEIIIHVQDAVRLSNHYQSLYQQVFDLITKRTRLVEESLDTIGPKVVTEIEEMKLDVMAEQNLLGPEMSNIVDEEINTTFWLALLAVITGLSIAIFLGRHLTIPIREMTNAMESLANDKVSIDIPFLTRKDEIGRMANTVQVFKNNAIKAKTGSSEIFRSLQAAENINDFCSDAISRLCKILHGGHGALYVLESDNVLRQKGSFGFQQRKSLNNELALGQGLSGQAALEKQQLIVASLPDDYIMISSALGESKPKAIIATPIIHKDKLLGVIEIATFEEIDETKQRMLTSIIPMLALNMENVLRSERTELLLTKTSQQAEALRKSEAELRASEEEMKASNEELFEKTNMLEERTQELLVSEEEARVVNEELTEKTLILERKQHDLETISQENVAKAEQLEQSNRYKSEFLANMSHELRTPLNSLLILAKSLADNKAGDLNDDSVEAAEVIHGSGRQLLELINDILDLSKIEAGKMDVVGADVDFIHLHSQIKRKFEHMAQEKGIELTLFFDENMPRNFITDISKVEQIITNLIGNAIKFTEQGQVKISFTSPSMSEDKQVQVSVADTGIGIDKNQLNNVFGAFNQADGASNRRFGGTGLGLSICLNLAKLLNGKISVESELGKGSCFSLVLGELAIDEANFTGASTVPSLPLNTGLRQETATISVNNKNFSSFISDDRLTLGQQKSLILIVEDDPVYAQFLLEQIHQKSMKAIAVNSGENAFIALKQHNFTGVLLDIGLPDMNGWQVLNKIKNDPALKHLVVHIVSVGDFDKKQSLEGAIGYLQKTSSSVEIANIIDKLVKHSVSPSSRILVVEDDQGTAIAIKTLITNLSNDIEVVDTGNKAIESMKNKDFGCIILDLTLPDMDGQDILAQLDTIYQQRVKPPIIVYSGRELSELEIQHIRQFTDSIVIKGSRATERLQDEVSLFLHSMKNLNLTKIDKQLTTKSANHEAVLSGKKILVVDDDMRNTFALSHVLRELGVHVIMAQDGEKSLKQLEKNTGIDAVLMDIMMPGMDGYETIAAIRQQIKYKTLPIIALTAKAMKGDRERCINAGANDYISKPVDTDLLLDTLHKLLGSS